VLDVAMPLMDGLELLQQLRAATGMQELPAIFLSARVDRQTVEAADRLGVAYLAKPFTSRTYAVATLVFSLGGPLLHQLLGRYCGRSSGPFTGVPEICQKPRITQPRGTPQLHSR
jgi:CheY-like chemotaxis protein